MDCIAKTSVPESSDERANNVQSGLALPAAISPSSNSIRFSIRPWEAGQGRRVQNTRVLQPRFGWPPTSLANGAPVGIVRPQRRHRDESPHRRSKPYRPPSDANCPVALLAESSVPVIAFKSGSVPEVIRRVRPRWHNWRCRAGGSGIVEAIGTFSELGRRQVRRHFEKRFTTRRMAPRKYRLANGKSDRLLKGDIGSRTF
jgi:hypothetical protein